MTSILNTLGLGAPSPAAYSDASAVATQKTQIVTSLQVTLAAMSTALMGAKAMGFPGPQIDSLKQHVADGTALLGQAATMGPAALQAKVSELESKFASSQFNITQTNYNSKVTALQAVINKVQARVTTIRADTTTSPELLAKYNTLLTDAQAAVATLQASPPVYRAPSDGSGSSSLYIIPTVLEPVNIQDRLDALDDEKDNEVGSGTNLTRFYDRIKRWVNTHFITYFIYITIFASMILGGIITSNLYLEVESSAVLSRIFYFIYGAIFYPVPIAYSCMPTMPSITSPIPSWPGMVPYWSAGLIPLWQRIPVIKIPTPIIEEPEATQAGGANVLDLFLGAKDAAASAVTQAAAAAASVTKTSNGVQIFNKESVVKNKDGSIKTSNEIQPVGITGRLFSFVIVDSKNPAPYQATNRTNLLYLSVAALIGNILIGVRSGFV
jgi:hypothetical protein